MEKDAGGLEYVSLSHESGATSKVFLFGGDLTSYVDADGTEWCLPPHLHRSRPYRLAEVTCSYQHR